MEVFYQCVQSTRAAFVYPCPVQYLPDLVHIILQKPYYLHAGGRVDHVACHNARLACAKNQDPEIFEDGILIIGKNMLYQQAVIKKQ